jgi:hypothetical protein
MSVATVHSLVPDHRPRAVQSGASEITLTVHIALGAETLPPAALGIIENLCALADPEHAVPRRQERDGIRGPLPAIAQRGPSLHIHQAARSVLCDGEPVRLTRREYDLLVFLARHPRRVFGRAQLLRQVWGYEMVSGERTVDVHVRRLRAKLGAGRPLVATVRGVGYRLDEACGVTLTGEAD